MNVNKHFTNSLRIVSILILYPYIVCFDSDSTRASNLNVSLGYGGGKYFSSYGGCNEITSPFRNFGGAIEYSADNFRAGLRGGIADLEDISDEYRPAAAKDTLITKQRSFRYIIPYFGISGRALEMRVGVIAYDVEKDEREMLVKIKYPVNLSFYLGIELWDEGKLTFSAFDNTPVLSCGGLYEAGIDYKIGVEKRGRFWGGISFLDGKNISGAIRLSYINSGSASFIFGAHCGLITPFYVLDPGAGDLNFGFSGTMIIPFAL